MTLKHYILGLKSNIVGIGVLGFGLLAVLAVGIFAYDSLTDSSEDGNYARISSEYINSFKNDKLHSQQSNKIKQKNKTSYKRQKSISEKQIVGSWDTRIKKGRALLQLQGGTYRLIIIMDNSAASRWYSNGRYKMQDDLLVLSPNMAWGPPKSKKYIYRILTRADIPVVVSKHKGKLVWQMPGPDVDIYVPNKHPLLSKTKDKIAVWKALK